MTDSGWKIPNDWNGEDWCCIRLAWPDSDGYRRLLIGLLYTLTRGREYDKGTGSIKGAQSVGWKIFDGNIPLTDCGGGNGGGESGSGEDGFPFDYRGGSMLVISEDDMGQVVTNVFVDPVTGELVVQFGHCCEERYSIADVAALNQDGTEVIDDVPGYPDTPTYSACAKARAILDAMWHVGQIVWDKADDIGAETFIPWLMQSAVQQAYPSVSFSIDELTRATFLALSLYPLGLEDETFRPGLKDRLACAFALLWDDTASGVGTEDYTAAWKSVKGATYDYYGVTELPEATIIGSFWEAIMLSFKRAGVKKLTTGVLSTGSEDCECPGDAAPVWPKQENPTTGGYYVGPELASLITADTSQGNAAICYGWTAGHDIFGFVFDSFHNVSSLDDVTLKRMQATAVDDCDEDFTVGYTSWFSDTSDHLENSPTGAWGFAPTAVTDELAAYIDQSKSVSADVGTPAVPLLTQGSDVVWKFALVSGGNVSVRFEGLRPVYNVNSPSHTP